MIVSHEKKFIFLKPMKVAGTSLEIALSRHCGPRDIITPFGRKDEALRQSLGFGAARNYQVPLMRQSMADWGRLLLHGYRRRLFLSHARASDVRAGLGPNLWDRYLKISVVRNPYDYAVSRYYWETRLGPLPEFRVWLLENPEILLENRRITHIDCVCAADVMIRYERFEEDLPRLSAQLGLPGNLHDDLKTITAKSSTRPRGARAAALFDGFPQGLDLVGLLCHEDITRYGYAPPGPGGSAPARRSPASRRSAGAGGC